MISSSAPGRIGVLGNPSDIYGGKVIAMAIQYRAYVWLKSASSLSVKTFQGDGDANLFNLIETSFKRLWKEGWVKESNPRMKVTIKTDVPRESGMGGSTAIVLAYLDACRKMYGLDFDKSRLAEMAQKIEHKELGIVAGYNDRYIIAFGGLAFMDFTGKDVDREVWDGEPYARIRPILGLEIPLLCGYWGVRRSSGSVHAPIRKRFLEGDPKITQAIKQLVDLTDMGEKAIIQGDWEELGRLMNKNYQIAQEIGWAYKIDDKLREIGLKHGAKAAKLGGAGNGGVMIFLCPEKREEVTKSLREAGAKVFPPRASSRVG